MKISKIAAGVTLAVAASVASADYVKFGFDENEVKRSDSETNNYSPAIAFGFQPVEGSPLKIAGYLRETFDDKSSGQKASNTRTQLKFSYKITSGDYTFAPAIRFRRDGKKESHEREIHLFANNSYKLNDSSSVFLNLYLNNWTDYKADNAGTKIKHFDYEVALGMNYALTSANDLNVQLFTEQAKTKGDAGKKTADWEVRAAVGHKFDDALSGNVFGRYTFKDTDNSATDTDKKSAKDWRLGAGLEYALDQDWTVSGEIFYTQDYKTYGANAEADKKKSKEYVYSLWITRSF